MKKAMKQRKLTFKQFYLFPFISISVWDFPMEWQDTYKVYTYLLLGGKFGPELFAFSQPSRPIWDAPGYPDWSPFCTTPCMQKPLDACMGSWTEAPHGDSLFTVDFFMHIILKSPVYMLTSCPFSIMEV